MQRMERVAALQRFLLNVFIFDIFFATKHIRTYTLTRRQHLRWQHVTHRDDRQLTTGDVTAFYVYSVRFMKDSIAVFSPHIPFHIPKALDVF